MELRHMSHLFILMLVAGTLSPVKASDALSLINQQRVNNGLTALVYNDKLATSAMAKACDMKSQGYWSHKNPQGKQWEFFTEAGYIYRYAGEDLAKECQDDRCVELWMKSPTHKAVILGKQYKDGAVSRCGSYLVFHAGTLQPKKTVFSFLFNLRTSL